MRIAQRLFLALVVAGPLSGNSDLRGIFIFDATKVAELDDMARQDPAIQSGRLVLQLHPWYAAAGLKVNDPK